MRRIVPVLCMICLAVQVNAQDSSTPSPIIFIYDASGSMWGQIDGMSKIEIATDVLSTSVNNFPENQNVGLVAYGHRQEGDCRDVEFIVSMDNNDKDLINQTLSEIRPLGRTPLAYSATQVINTLRESEERATVILVTDGIESCDGNICEVVQAAKMKVSISSFISSVLDYRAKKQLSFNVLQRRVAVSIMMPRMPKL